MRPEHRTMIERSTYDTRARLDSAAAALPIAPAELWAMFQSNKDQAWAELLRLEEGILLRLAGGLSAWLDTANNIRVSPEAIYSDWAQKLARKRAGE